MSVNEIGGRDWGAICASVPQSTASNVGAFSFAECAGLVVLYFIDDENHKKRTNAERSPHQPVARRDLSHPVVLGNGGGAAERAVTVGRSDCSSRRTELQRQLISYNHYAGSCASGIANADSRLPGRAGGNGRGHCHRITVCRREI